ncbi:pentapeptide repeat-containing protein [Lentzea sp. NPDC004789]
MTESDRRSPQIYSRLPVLQWRWVGLVGLLTLAVTGGGLFVLLKYTQALGDVERARANLDAIRTALSLAIGTGGAFALWLTARKQRSTEIQIVESSRIAEETKRHQERIAESSEFDTRERRITDLYTKAVEQLGSEKAPVRLGGLYALERLAHGNADHCQTIINILCAYLRMPYHLPVDTEPNYYQSAPPSILEGKTKDELYPYEELQVRLTAQRILQSLLRADESHPLNTCDCKDVYDISLRGAVLVGLELRRCHIGRADFAHAKFVSTPHIRETVFRRDVWFYEADFDIAIDLEASTFLDQVAFTRCLVPGTLWAHQARFEGTFAFIGVTLGSLATFTEASFGGDVEFDDCTLTTDHYGEFKMAEEGWPSPGFDFSEARLKTRPGQVTSWPNGWRACPGSGDETEIVRSEGQSSGRET